MANINEYVTYTIIDEADYNDLVKTTIDGVRLLRTDDEEMYMCTDDITKIIPTASSALCVKNNRKYNFDIAQWGWVRAKFTDGGYYCADAKQRAPLTFVNTRLVFAYIKNMRKYKKDDRRPAVLDAILEAAVTVFDQSHDWVSFCTTSKTEYDLFKNKYRHSQVLPNSVKKPTKGCNPVVQITELPSTPVTEDAVVKVAETNRLDLFIKELSRVATSEGVEITITIKPANK